MISELIKLAVNLEHVDFKSSMQILVLAGRYDDTLNSLPVNLQPAYKYVMYLRLMRNLDNSTFFKMKRKYLNSSLEIQEECRQELDKIILDDALKTGISSGDIRKEFQNKLRTVEAID